MTSLYIGNTETGELRLPVEAITTMTAIIGRRGSGKTTTAMVVSEEAIGQGLPVVLIDPLGVAWGLRSSADGNAKGLPVNILGGAHGDIPLEETAGKLIADLVVERPGAYIVDLSGFDSRSAERRFATDFAERLFRAKEKHREALLLVVDEADTFAPQRSADGDQRMLGAFEAIARRGRVRGLGGLLITQRPAVLNKNLLSQTELLIAHQVTAPQDRAALKEWAQGNATPDQVTAFIDSLASLQVGEAWVWSPAWLNIFERVTVRRRRTFDSSATPKPGETRIEPKVLADVDLDELRARMAETIERADAEDPKKLRQRIAALERELAVVRENRTTEPCGHEELIADLQERLEATAGQVASMRSQLANVLGGFASVRDQINELLEESDGDTGADSVRRNPGDEAPSGLSGGTGTGTREGSGPASAQEFPVAGRRNEGSDRGVRTLPRSPEPRGMGASEAGVSRPQQRLLDTLASFAGLGVHELSRSNLAVMAGVGPRSSGYEKNLSTLRTGGFIDYPTKGSVSLTPQGAGAAQPSIEIRTRAQLHDAWYSKVSRPQAALLRVLVRLYPAALSREELARAADVSVLSSGFEKNVSTLSSLGLVRYPTRGQVAATDLLFPEGVPA